VAVESGRRRQPGSIVGWLASTDHKRIELLTLGTALVLMLVAGGLAAMSVWGHHMFITGQSANYYFSLTSIALVIPAGIEYFDMLATLVGGRLRFPTAMLFALAFIPQFLVGGLTGIMAGTPALDYQIQDSYFLVGHWHYTLAAGSLFGLFAGVYFWFPKATGRILREGLGKAHFWLWFAGTNLTFLPMFWLGFHGMLRRIPSYLPADGFTTGNLISSIGAGLLGLGAMVFMLNVAESLGRPRYAVPDPWEGHTLEWATSSPPPTFNFSVRYPVPPVRSYAPLLDLREQHQHVRSVRDDPASGRRWWVGRGQRCARAGTARVPPHPPGSPDLHRRQRARGGIRAGRAAGRAHRPGGDAATAAQIRQGCGVRGAGIRGGSRRLGLRLVALGAGGLPAGPRRLADAG
jgi:heme/copper-type cytochrome/quinol oxidase subunit 1